VRRKGGGWKRGIGRDDDGRGIGRGREEKERGGIKKGGERRGEGMRKGRRWRGGKEARVTGREKEGKGRRGRRKM